MSETLHFTKMHGAGNDYIYFNCLDSELADPAGVADLHIEHFGQDI